MRALVQRVSQASVSVGGVLTGEIGSGLLVFLGVKVGDSQAAAAKLVRKISQLRIFADEAGKMNLSLLDISGAMLVVSQFTLYADTTKGNRPSYISAARPEVAQALYEFFLSECRQLGLRVESGVFQAHMNVQLTNDGPVTILCEIEE
jgi:D-aminoacyl-tRNA deacylase